MAGTVSLAIVLHAHQPIGQENYVFEDNYTKAYLPFLEELARTRVKVNLHFTGILLAWLARKHPEYLDSLQELVQRGQVELLTGAFYEAILPVIPERDRVRQITRQTRWIRKRFGAAPQGLWLAERVWEPQLVDTLANVGVEWVCVDDAHFLSEGIPPDQLAGYFTTDSENRRLVRILPLDRQLRYLIPWKEPAEVVEYLTGCARDVPNNLRVFGDDWEKFGGWPGTHDWVFRKRWLRKFLAALEANRERITPVLISRFVADHPPKGRAYLPTATYWEMSKWALPKRAQQEYEWVYNEAKAEDRTTVMKFLKGGYWRSFFAKYPEANWMHKRMLHVSALVDKTRARHPEDKDALDRARDLLLQAQCNCPYWHGTFGGIYINFLRQAIYRRLIEAQVLCERFAPGTGTPATGIAAHLDERAVVAVDLDLDGAEELLVNTPAQQLIYKPRDGASLHEWDVKACTYNFTSAMSRYPEPYHDALREKQPEAEFVYDWYARTSDRVHLLDPGILSDLTSLKRGTYPERGDFVNCAFTHAVGAEAAGAFGPVDPLEGLEDSVQLTFSRSGGAWLGDARAPVTFHKLVRVSKTRAEHATTYALENIGPDPVELVVGLEHLLAFLAGDADDRYYEVRAPATELRNPKLGSTGTIPGSPGLTVRLVDAYEHFHAALQFHLRTPYTLYRYPLRTVTQKVAAFERNYQASVLLPLVPVTVPARERLDLGTIRVSADRDAPR